MKLADHKSCFDLDSLRRFNDGSLPPHAAERVAKHIETCQRCCEQLNNLGVGLDLGPALASQSGPFAYEAEAEYELVEERLNAIGNSFSVEWPRFSPDAIRTALEDLNDLREYRIVEELGQGGMGAVYLAHHAKLDRFVALKVLPLSRVSDPSAIKRFEREMRAVGRLDHENIVRALDAGEVGHTHYLVMEYVEGIDLSKLIKCLGPLPLADACELVRQAAVGLEEAHEHNVVHRDIKPSNLVLCQPKKGRPALVKILDLGLAMLSAAHLPDQQELTTTGQAMGTLDYMAPEQGGDSKHVTPLADIYSLGATLFKLLTGEAVYEGVEYRSPVQKLTGLANHPVPPIQERRGDIPAELATVVHRMLQKEPGARYATARQVYQALEPFCHGHDLASRLAEARQLAPQLPAGSQSEENRPESLLTNGDPLTAVSTVNQREQTAGSADDREHNHSPLPGPHRHKTPLAPIIGLGIIGCALLAWLATVIFVRTPEGTLRVEIHDPEVEVLVMGTNLVLKHADNQEVKLSPGEKTLLVRRGDFEFKTDSLQLQRGEIATVSINLVNEKLRVLHDGTVLGEKRLPLPETAAALPIDPVVEVTPAAIDEPRDLAQPLSPWSRLPTDAPQPAVVPFTVEEAVAHQQAWAAYLSLPVEYTNELGMKLRLIPPGEFRMGNVRGSLAGTDFEPVESDEIFAATIPQHKVLLTQAFYLGTYEVTQSQFAALMGRVDSIQLFSNEQAPITNLPFSQMATFCNHLSAQQQLSESYDLSALGLADSTASGYRLPTEAQWDFAARGGVDELATFEGEYLEFARVDYNSRIPGTNDSLPTVVGTLRPNGFGLYDMLGNVTETCDDYYDPNYFQQFAQSVAVDPRGPVTGAERVFRGGHYTGHFWENFFRHGGRGQGFRVSLPAMAVKELLARNP